MTSRAVALKEGCWKEVDTEREREKERREGGRENTAHGPTHTTQHMTQDTRPNTRNTHTHTQHNRHTTQQTQHNTHISHIPPHVPSPLNANRNSTPPSTVHGLRSAQRGLTCCTSTTASSATFSLTLTSGAKLPLSTW